MFFLLLYIFTCFLKESVASSNPSVQESSLHVNLDRDLIYDLKEGKGADILNAISTFENLLVNNTDTGKSKKIHKKHADYCDELRKKVTEVAAEMSVEELCKTLSSSEYPQLFEFITSSVFLNEFTKWKDFKCNALTPSRFALISISKLSTSTFSSMPLDTLASIIEAHLYNGILSPHNCVRFINELLTHKPFSDAIKKVEDKLTFVTANFWSFLIPSKLAINVGYSMTRFLDLYICHLATTAPKSSKFIMFNAQYLFFLDKVQQLNLEPKLKEELKRVLQRMDEKCFISPLLKEKESTLFKDKGIPLCNNEKILKDLKLAGKDYADLTDKLKTYYRSLLYLQVGGGHGEAEDKIHYQDWLLKDFDYAESSLVSNLADNYRKSPVYKFVVYLLTDRNSEFTENLILYQALAVRTKAKADANPANLSCKDHNGKDVDWWIVYLENGSKKYRFMSSNGESGQLERMEDEIDSDGSPIIKTIYQHVHYNDNTVFFGWNDQQSKISNSELNHDYMERSVNSSTHAHSKGFFAIKSVTKTSEYKSGSNYNSNSNSESESESSNEPPKSSTVSSFAILTSCPEFPNLPTMPARNGITRYALPQSPKDIFSGNIGKNAQHFMCISMRDDEVPLENDEIKYDPKEMNRFNHVKFLRDYTRVIHAAIVGTNFNQFSPKYKVWRNSFGNLKEPPSLDFELEYRKFLDTLQTKSSGCRVLSGKNLESVKKYHKVAELSGFDRKNNPDNSDTPSLFSLSASKFYWFENNIWYSPTDYYSKRVDYNYKYIFDSDTKVEERYRTGFIDTTDNQKQLRFAFFAKNPSKIIDIYDDWIARKFVDLNRQINLDSDKDRKMLSEQDEKVEYGLFVQHWMDRQTLPNRPERKFYDEKGGFIGGVQIYNVGLKEFKNNNGEGLSSQFQSIGTDHSKWAIGYGVDKKQVLPFFCFSDLNRTRTQAKLIESDVGRGGGAFCAISEDIWRALTDTIVSIQPDTFLNQKDAVKKIQDKLRKHIIRKVTVTEPNQVIKS